MLVTSLPSQRPLFSELEARDAALNRVVDHAGTDWRERATAVVLSLTGHEVTGEDVRLACEQEGVRPHHHNAWGGFIAMLVKHNTLIPTGRYVPMRATGSHARKTQVYTVHGRRQEGF